MVSLVFVIALLFVLPGLASSHREGHPPPLSEGMTTQWDSTQRKYKCFVRGRQVPCPRDDDSDIQARERTQRRSEGETQDDDTFFVLWDSLLGSLAGNVYRAVIVDNVMQVTTPVCSPGLVVPGGPNTLNLIWRGSGGTPYQPDPIVVPPGTAGGVYVLPDDPQNTYIVDQGGTSPDPDGDGSGSTPGSSDGGDDTGGDGDTGGDDGTGGSPGDQPFTPGAASKNKVIVRNNLIEHYIDLDALGSLVRGGGDLSEYWSAANAIEDGFRAVTSRLWYGYGFRTPPNYIQSPGVSPKPMFGYYPVTNSELTQRAIADDLNAWRFGFALGAQLNSADFPGDYFRLCEEAGMSWVGFPIIYISEFGREVPIYDTTRLVERVGSFTLANNLRDFMTGADDFKIKHWNTSDITIKRFDYRELDGVTMPYSEAPEAFEAFVDIAMERGLLATRQRHPSGFGLSPVPFPLRYYDYVFETPTVDNLFHIDSVYNGYFAESYENAISNPSFESVLEPVIPNIYMVDFSRLEGIEEYYRIISLSNEIRREYGSFPDNFTSQYLDLLTPWGYSHEYIYASCMWVKTIHEILDRECDPDSRSWCFDDLLGLADEYSSLIFSNAFKAQYNATRANVSALRDPFYFDIHFRLSDRVLFPHITNPGLYAPEFEIIRTAPGSMINPYDSLTHLISDTQLTLNKKEYFDAIHIDSTIGTYSNCNTKPMSIPYVLDKPCDYVFEVNNVWDINEWFKLYCVLPEDPDDREGWELFFDAFPEQRGMLEADPRFWVHNPSRPKPLPIGGFHTDVSPDDRGTILFTPDGDQWEDCSGTGVITTALSGLYSNLRSHLAKSFRTYKDVVDGCLAHSEPLFYRLQKKDSCCSLIPRPPTACVPDPPVRCSDDSVDPDKCRNPGEVIQNFFFPATLLQGDFSFVDSQVKYGLQHGYDLYAYHFVVGNEYWYEQKEDYVPSYDPESWTCPEGWSGPVEIPEGSGNWVCEPEGEGPGAWSWDYNDFHNATLAGGIGGFDPRALVEVNNPIGEEDDWETHIPYTGQIGYAAGAALRQRIWFDPERAGGYGDLDHSAGVAGGDGDVNAFLLATNSFWGNMAAYTGGDGRPGFDNRFVISSATHKGADMIGIFDPDGAYAGNTSAAGGMGRTSPWRSNWEKAGRPVIESATGRTVPLLVDLANGWFAFWTGNLEEGEGLYRWEFHRIDAYESSATFDYFADNFYWGGEDRAREHSGVHPLTRHTKVYRNNLHDFIEMMLDHPDFKYSHITIAAYDSTVNQAQVAAARATGVDYWWGYFIRDDLRDLDNWWSVGCVNSPSPANERDVGSIIFPRYGGIDATIPPDYANGPGTNMSTDFRPAPGEPNPYSTDISRWTDTDYGYTDNDVDGYSWLPSDPGEYYAGCCRRWWAMDYYDYLWNPARNDGLYAFSRMPSHHRHPVFSTNSPFSDPRWAACRKFNKIVDDMASGTASEPHTVVSQAPHIAPPVPRIPSAPWYYDTGQFHQDCLHYECRLYHQRPPDAPPITPEPADQYTFIVNNRPHLVLVETRAFSSNIDPDNGITTKIRAKPPLPPDIDIVPYRSVKDKTLLMLNSNVGKYKDSPKIIEPEDLETFRDVIDSQYDLDRIRREELPLISNIDAFNIEDFTLVFESDDYPEVFEVYRIDFPPRSYRDFSGARRAILDNTLGGHETPIIKTSNSIIEEVVPNKKYWYTFRVVDVHEDISNPTPVLEFEMVDTGNSIYPTIQEYSFPEPETLYTKASKKYLKISAASIHEMKHQNVRNARTFINNPDLGSRVEGDASIWGKNYKLRLTSKLSGKRLDVNFAFKQKSVKDLDNPEDEAGE
jgi:hypothetical protein